MEHVKKKKYNDVLTLGKKLQKLTPQLTIRP